MPNYRKRSFLASSITALVLYSINLLATILLLAMFITVFVKTNSYSEDAGCFLYSTENVLDISDLAAICDGSIAVISLLILLNLILAYLGIASIVISERTSCKCIEIIVVLFSTVLVTLFAVFLSIGVYYEREDLCNDNDLICEKNEYIFYVISWFVAILSFVAFMAQFVDCLCHLPSSGNRNLTISREETVATKNDGSKYLLTDSQRRSRYYT